MLVLFCKKIRNIAQDLLNIEKKKTMQQLSDGEQMFYD